MIEAYKVRRQSVELIYLLECADNRLSIARTLYPIEGNIVLLIEAAESNHEDDNVLQIVEGMDPIHTAIGA